MISSTPAVLGSAPLRPGECPVQSSPGPPLHSTVLDPLPLLTLQAQLHEVFGLALKVALQVLVLPQVAVGHALLQVRL